MYEEKIVAGFHWGHLWLGGQSMQTCRGSHVLGMNLVANTLRVKRSQRIVLRFMGTAEESRVHDSTGRRCGTWAVV